MRSPWYILAMFLLGFSPASAIAQHGQHLLEKEFQPGESRPSVLTGRLVDSTWFVSQGDAHSEREQMARASTNLASGVPAAILPEDGEAEKVMWLLLTNSTVLAPYAGKRTKVEGRLLNENRAIVPTAVYVDDAGTWRQVQLAAPPEKPPMAETPHADEKTPAPTEKPTTTHAGHAVHPTEQEKPAAPPEQSTKTEPDQADHQAEHLKPEATTQEEGDEENHHASEAASTRNHKPDGDRKSEGDPKHDGEHKHWLVLAMPPAHPLLVNFTAGLFPASVLAEWLGKLLRWRSLTTAAWWMLFFAAVIAPLTALAGWLWFRELGDMGHAQMVVHKWLGLSLAVSLPLLAVWRARTYARDRDPSSTYLIVITAALLALTLQGHLGATMSFGRYGPETQSSPHEH